MTTSATAPPDRLHTLAEVAEKYGLPLRPLKDSARANPPGFTHIHLGRERYLTDEMVTALLASNTKTASTAKSKKDDGLDGVRARLARRPPRRRKPAA